MRIKFRHVYSTFVKIYFSEKTISSSNFIPTLATSQIYSFYIVIPERSSNEKYSLPLNRRNEMIRMAHVCPLFRMTKWYKIQEITRSLDSGILNQPTLNNSSLPPSSRSLISTTS